MSDKPTGVIVQVTDLGTGEVGMLELNGAQAWAFAELLKRIGFTEWSALSVDRAELEHMRAACDVVQRAFANAGWRPR